MDLRNKHHGERCFIIGSGPSVARMDLSWLKGEITICVNQAYKALPFAPTYICIGDRELWPRVKDVYASMPSTIVCASGSNGTVGADYAGKNLAAVVPLNKDLQVAAGHFRHDLKEVYVAFNVVPEIALPFVLHAGFAACYLVGCDCTNEGYFYSRSEDARPDYPQRIVPGVLDAYDVIRRYVEAHELTHVMNATYGGRLEAFPRVSFDGLRPGAPRTPLVVGFHTPHARYRELARGMAQSVRDFGLPVFIREVSGRQRKEIPSTMSWVLNCAIKPEFIRDMMEEFPGRDLIYLDADAVMHKRPALYLDAPRDYDFAAPYLTNSHVTDELQGNSLYFAATPAAWKLVSAWCEEQRVQTEAMLSGTFSGRYQEAWDQVTLQTVASRMTDVRQIRLPLTYAKIMPTPNGYEITPDVPLAQAVITQHQASREMRQKQNDVDAAPTPSTPGRPAIRTMSASQIRENQDAARAPAASRWIFGPHIQRVAKLQVTGSNLPLERRFEELSRAEFETFAPFIGKPRRVLDLACGLGRVSVYLSRRLDDPGVVYVLADSSGGLDDRPRYGYDTKGKFYNDLALTAEFCQLNGLGEFKTFDVRRGDWSTLHGWPDLIVSMLGIGFHVPLEKVIDELHRVSNPETVLVFGIPGEKDAPDWEQQHDFSRWFSMRRVVPFTSAYPTHEGRVLVLAGKRTPAAEA